jgi:hypothetical protein
LQRQRGHAAATQVKRMPISEDAHRPGAAPRRRICIAVAAVLASGISACKARDNTTPTQGQRMDKDKKELVYFDVNLYSYLERPIFDVYLNGKFIGDAAGQPHRGKGGLMTGVAVPVGPQIVTWRLGGPEGMAGNGDTVKAANQPVLLRPKANLTYLGVHIYPDNTVEFVPEPFWPEKTLRGEEINRQWEKNNGQ